MVSQAAVQNYKWNYFSLSSMVLTFYQGDPLTEFCSRPTYQPRLEPETAFLYTLLYFFVLLILASSQ